MSIKETFNKVKNSMSVSMKLIIIGVLILFFIPASYMVEELVMERSGRQSETISEVSSKWGQAQTISGPVLAIPYSYFNSTRYAYFLPANLSISGDVKSEVRSRGIYDVPLYEGEITLSGNFNYPDLNSLGVAVNSALWNQAFVSIGIPDMRGITEQLKINFAGGEKIMNPGVKSDIFDSGVSASVFIDPKNPKSYDFSVSLNLRGSEYLYFMPFGKETALTLKSDWTSPSFDGAFLPVSHKIDENGFEASWKVLDLNRNFPQEWLSGDKTFEFSNMNYYESAFGVKFFMPVDVYQKTERSAKYAMAVIALVFAVFFLVEITAKRRIHPLQYIMIGFALLIFYTLLLSLAEYIKFGYAYLISSAATIVMVTAYSKVAMKSRKYALMCGGFLTLLYIYVYVLLQMEDFTLLLGSIGLFVILAVVMYVTRHIDWYSGGQERVE